MDAGATAVTTPATRARRPARGAGRVSAPALASAVLHGLLLVGLGYVTTGPAHLRAAAPAATEIPIELDVSYLDPAAAAAEPIPEPEPKGRADDLRLESPTEQPVAVDAPPPLEMRWDPADLADLPLVAGDAAEGLRPTIGVATRETGYRFGDPHARAPGSVMRRRGRGSPDGVVGGQGSLQARPAAPTPVTVAPPEPPPPPAPVVEPVRLVSAPKPVYPESARDRSIQGVVELVVEVLEDGTVGEVTIVATSGSRLLDDAAVRAVKRWTFEPARTDGVAERARVQLPPIRFRLE